MISQSFRPAFENAAKAAEYAACAAIGTFLTGAYVGEDSIMTFAAGLILATALVGIGSQMLIRSTMRE